VRLQLLLLNSYIGSFSREKAAESEREIERRRQLELERAKTRELQFNLEMEREKMTQVLYIDVMMGNYSLGYWDLALLWMS
jgi:hypothetical protein